MRQPRLGMTMLFGALACAASSDSPADETTSSGAGTTATMTEASGDTSAAITSNESGTTADAETTTDPDGSTTSDECGCAPSVARALDEELADGFTAADMIAAFDGTELPFQWTGYDGQPTTTLHYSLTYDGGVIEEGPGGEDGCAFMAMPCPGGLLIEIELNATTDDGWLAWTAPATLEGRLDETMVLAVMPQDISTNAGTLAEQPYEYEGIPSEIGTLELDAGRNVGRRTSWATVIGWSPQVSGVLLGENL